MDWQELQGHDTIKQSLQSALAQNRVAHAYLFFGPTGVGKKTAGYLLARALLDDGHQDPAQNTGIYHDLHVIRPLGNSIKIEQLRDLSRDVSYTSHGGGRQVYLVEQAEKMTREAANCMLKVLEEPPPGVVFILVADDVGALLPTIVSRCQRYQFHLLPEQDVCRVLEIHRPGDLGRARAVARIAHGSPGRALALWTGGDRRDRFWDLLAQLVQQRPYGALLPLAGLEKREDLAAFIDTVLLFFRDALVWRLTGQEALLINIDYREQIHWLADHYSKQEMLEILLTLHKSARRVAGNVNLRLVLDNLVLKVAGFGYA